MNQSRGQLFGAHPLSVITRSRVRPSPKLVYDCTRSWSYTRNSIGIGPYSRRIKIGRACFSPRLHCLSHVGQTIPDVVPGRYEPTAVARDNLFRLRPYRVQTDGDIVMISARRPTSIDMDCTRPQTYAYDDPDKCDTNS